MPHTLQGKWAALQLLLLLVSTADGQNSSLRINTNLKEFNQSLQESGANVCTRVEHYVEIVPVPVMQPVKVRTSNWCLEIPPRCASYKTEMRQVMKVQHLNKTRTVRFCCDGYEGNLSDSKAQRICRPICRGGCGRGSCLAPDLCVCEEGYTGKHCTQRCDHDRWGLGCKNLCQCQNDAVCDNKSGLCHCIAGWAGQFCEQPCPPGTHGVMCRKACECADKLCHPQTGDCISDRLPNVTHVMFETLNSTIANITHNLDHIAKKIGSMSESELAPSSTAKPVPEVILIKQAPEELQHAPKIILHQSGSDLLENLHTAGTKTPDVIHVITNWPVNGTAQEHNGQLNLAGLGGEHEHVQPTDSHDASLLIMLLIILLLVMIGLTVSFLYVYRRYHWHKVQLQTTQANGAIASTGGPEVVLTEASLGKSFLKPLPELPRRQPINVAKQYTNEETPELYDTPSNNSSTKTQSYAYARKESLYSSVSPKSRKGSVDSHLYDEVRYHQQQQHQQQQQQQQQLGNQSYHGQQTRRFQHATQVAAYLPPPMPLGQANGHGNSSHQHQPHPATHHVSHLIIPPQNSKFLQVPTHITARKITHL